MATIIADSTEVTGWNGQKLCREYVENGDDNGIRKLECIAQGGIDRGVGQQGFDLHP